MIPSTTSTDPESATPSVAEDEVFANESEGAKASLNDEPKSFDTSTIKRLSTVSKMYDVDGNGQLDDAELAMRDMDKSGRGYLTNEKVYALMQEQLATQKQLFRVKRIMFVLLALVVILAFSNLGTSFAAASLAKDTTTSSSAALLDKKTNEAVSTQTASDSLTFERAIITPDGRRKLCDEDNVNCVDFGLSDENSILSMDQRTCRKMIKQCRRGNTVSLTRTWKNEDTTSFNICPYTGTLSRDNLSEVTNSRGLKFTFEPIRGGHCQVGGIAIAQPEGRICEARADCAGDLGCRKIQKFVATCQQRCAMKRWAHSHVLKCQNNCDHSSCQADEVA